jgi:hypothetical protein
MLRVVQDRLRHEPIVEKVEFNCRRIRITFKTGLRESWWHRNPAIVNRHIDIPDDPFLGNALHLTTQKSVYNCDTSKLHFISLEKWFSGNFYDQRLIIHKLINQYIVDGYVDMKYIPEECFHDLKRLQNFNYGKLISNNVFFRRGFKHPPGLKVIDQYSDWGESIKNFWTPRNIYWAIYKCFKTNRDPTRGSVGRIVGRRNGLWFHTPLYYITILRTLGISSGSILDPYPTPIKAVAATIVGCKYQTPKDFSDLSSFLGTKFEAPGRANFLLLDYNIRSFGNWADDVRLWGRQTDFQIILSRDRIKGALRYLQVVLRPDDIQGWFSVLRMPK